jgi:hypothetical protein
MTRAAFTISHTAEVQTRTAKLIARPEDLCLIELEASLLNNLPSAVTTPNLPDAKAINAVKRSQLISLVHAWLYLQTENEAPNVSRNIEHIINKRITPTLLRQIWFLYQHYHQLPNFSKFLITLAQTIPAKDGRFFFAWLSALSPSADPVEALLKLANSEQADAIREDFWQTEQLAIKYPLAQAYAGILFPDNKQKITSDVLRNRPLTSLLTAMDIAPDTPYLIDFLIDFFTICDDYKISNNMRIWLYTLAKADLSGKLAIIQAYLQKFRLEPKWLPLNQAIEQLAESDYLLNKLDHKAQTHFRQWQLIDRINQHIGDQERKQLFYLEFLLQLREIVDWTDNMKIVLMTDFVLADDQEEPDQLWFIDNNTYQMLAEAGHTDILHFENGREIPTARDITLNHSGENIVRLKLDEVNILYARDFINQRLKTAKQ